ncbi:MAG: stage V sporulation protein SpoVM [Clostridia bacterium]|nr:stage V sporulation protein SpoVM [Clostridia bacterium]
MKIVVWRSPRILAPFLRKIFGIRKAPKDKT